MTFLLTGGGQRPDAGAHVAAVFIPYRDQHPAAARGAARRARRVGAWAAEARRCAPGRGLTRPSAARAEPGPNNATPAAAARPCAAW